MAEGRTSDAKRPEGGRDSGRPPERPTQLPGGSWWAAVKRTVREFQVDNLSDWAAALTYYSVLSIFPALLVLISVVDLAGSGTIQTLLDNLGQVVPGSVNQILHDAITNLQQTRGPAGVVALVSLAGVIIFLVWLWLSNIAILFAFILMWHKPTDPSATPWSAGEWAASGQEIYLGLAAGGHSTA